MAITHETAAIDNVKIQLVDAPAPGVHIRVVQTRGIDKEMLIEEIEALLEMRSVRGELTGRTLFLAQGLDPIWLPRLFDLLHGSFACQWIGVHERDGYRIIVSRDPTRFSVNQKIADRNVTFVETELVSVA